MAGFLGLVGLVSLSCDWVNGKLDGQLLFQCGSKSSCLNSFSAGYPKAVLFTYWTAGSGAVHCPELPIQEAEPRPRGVLTLSDHCSVITESIFIIFGDEGGGGGRAEKLLKSL